MTDINKRLLIPIFVLFCIILIGTLGYILIEGWEVLDALYMTVITITTVGYGEVQELSRQGIIFTIIMAILGVGTVFYLLGTGVQFIIEGELHKGFWRKRMEKKIEHLKDHYIVCGYGRMGKVICHELRVMRKQFVIIDNNPSQFTDVPEDVLYFEGDATDDSTLKRMGVDRAKCLIAAVTSDAENLFVVLSARGLCPDLFIVSRTESQGSEQKMLRAGANKVVSAYKIGALRLVETALRPAVVDFLELATMSGNLEVQMEEYEVKEGSTVAGQSLEASAIDKKLGVIVVAINKPNGRMDFNPSSDSVIESGDVLIVLGDCEKLEKLESYIAKPF